MSFLERNFEHFEVEISGFKNRPFYAQVNAKTRDLSVITDAIEIVDSVYAQKFGPYGTHYYSFTRREHFLNLLLRFYDVKNKLPNKEEIETLKDICKQKLYYQRDADLNTKNKFQINKTNKQNPLPKWYGFFLIICLLEIIPKFTSKLEIEARKINIQSNQQNQIKFSK